MYVWDTDVLLTGDQTDGAYVVKGNAGHWVALAGRYGDGDRDIGGNLAVRGNLAVTGTSALTGAVTLSASLAVGTSLTVTGAATIGTTLGVTGATTLSDTLGVTGLATFNNINASAITVTVGVSALTLVGTSSVTSGGTLSVTGEASFLAGATVADAPVNPTDVVRKQDLDAGGGQTVNVADIRNPDAEMASLSGVNTGDLLLVIGPEGGDDKYTWYLWDTVGSTSSPHIVAGDGGHWHATAGEYGIDLNLLNDLFATGIGPPNGTEKHFGMINATGTAFNPDNLDLDFSLDDDVADDALHMRASDGYIGMRISAASITDPVHIGEDVRFDAEVHGTRHLLTFGSGEQTTNPDPFEFFVGAASNQVAGVNTGVMMPDAGSIIGFTVCGNINAYSSTNDVDWHVTVNGTSVFSTSTTISATGQLLESASQARDTDSFVAGDIINVSGSKQGTTFQISDVVFMVDVILDDMNA
jgi:hypothetical protein